MTIPNITNLRKEKEKDEYFVLMLVELSLPI
jgi:hypothetical protein